MGRLLAKARVRASAGNLSNLVGLHQLTLFEVLPRRKVARFTIDPLCLKESS